MTKRPSLRITYTCPSGRPYAMQVTRRPVLWTARKDNSSELSCWLADRRTQLTWTGRTTTQSCAAGWWTEGHSSSGLEGQQLRAVLLADRRTQLRWTGRTTAQSCPAGWQTEGHSSGGLEGQQLRAVLLAGGQDTTQVDRKDNSSELSCWRTEGHSSGGPEGQQLRAVLLAGGQDTTQVDIQTGIDGEGDGEGDVFI